MLQSPPSKEEGRHVQLVKGPNVASIPDLEPLPDELELPVLLKMGDDISTDEILPAGTRVLPYRSNIPEISKFCFEAIDDSYYERARKVRDKGGHVIVAGNNYGQGSSREHAALAPRYLGLRCVLVKRFARIHWENLVNFGVLPLVFQDENHYESIEPGAILQIHDVREQVLRGGAVEIRLDSRTLTTRHAMSDRQVDILLQGGLINWAKDRVGAKRSSRGRDSDTPSRRHP
jgi:aconitate hydratase